MFAARLIRDKRSMMMATSAVAALIVNQNRLTYADTMSSSFTPYPGVTVGISVSGENDMSEDDLKWEYKRKSCAVCKMFLESPCKSSFKSWKTCSDDAKEAGLDPNTECSQLSQDLLACTNTNDSFFRAQANEAALLRRQQMEARRSKYRMSLSGPESVLMQPSAL